MSAHNENRLKPRNGRGNGSLRVMRAAMGALILGVLGTAYVAGAQTRAARPKFTPIPRPGQAAPVAVAAPDGVKPPPGPPGVIGAPGSVPLGAPSATTAAQQTQMAAPSHAAYEGQQPTPVPKYDPKGLIVYFIGQRNGEIEPCGCVKNQLGGMQYEAEIYTMAPRDQSIRVDVGAWNNGFFNPEVAMKTGYALRAMGGPLDLDAVNVSRQDLELGRDYFQDLAEKYPDAVNRLVSANIYYRVEADKPAFPAYRIVERQLPDGKPVRVAIIGVTSEISATYPSGELGRPDSAVDYVVRNAKESLAKVVPELKDKADLIVLAAHAPWAEALQIAQAYPDIDLVLAPLPGAEQQGKIDGSPGTYGIVWGSQGKYVSRIDLIPAADGNWAQVGNIERIGVSPKALKAHQDLVDLIADFKKKTETLTEEAPAQQDRVFAGATACVGCHTAEYQTWKDSRHSHALQSLVAKGSQFDPQCLKCHTVGYKKDNGFYNIRSSMAMANVQCETCHGPAADHTDRENVIRNGTLETMGPVERNQYLAAAKKAVPPKAVPESVCIQCHVGENDPHFKYDDYIGKVNHSGRKEAAAAAAAAKAAAGVGAAGSPAPVPEPAAGPAAAPVPVIAPGPPPSS